jgi:hypothetical protein
MTGANSTKTTGDGTETSGTVFGIMKLGSQDTKASKASNTEGQDKENFGEQRSKIEDVAGMFCVPR